MAASVKQIEDLMNAMGEDLLWGVKRYAQENYQHGWDVIVEAYVDEDLMALIGKVKSLQAAISKVWSQVVKPHRDWMQENATIEGYHY